MALLLIACAALAQAPADASPKPVSPHNPRAVRSAAGMQVKDAGVYHLASGTWSRGNQTLQRGGPANSDVVYSNTSNDQGLWTVGIGSLQLPGQITYDEGVLPTPANFTPGLGTQPDRGVYEITAIEIQYCDMQTTSMSSSWRYTFYESFDPLDNPANLPIPAAAVLDLTGLPSNGCWTVQIDLSGGNEFTMRGDGAPITPDWQNDPQLDSFGYGVEYTAPLGGPAAGMFFGGDPEFTGGIGGFGAGTYFSDPTETNTACGTTGFGALDGFTIVANSQTVRTPANYANGVGCGQGASPFGSTYLRMFARTGPGASIGSSYCVANPNSSGAIARMQAIGSSIAVSDRLSLRCNGLPNESFGFFLASRQPGFTLNPAGSQGNLCIGGVIGRLDEIPQVKNSGTLGEVALSTELGEWSLTSIPLGGGNFPVTAGQRWHFTYWFRDIVGGAPTSNFADGVFIDFN